jgi:Pyruvate/2-oxoacid:ferredoxin oxidoreductase delta subunit
VPPRHLRSSSAAFRRALCHDPVRCYVYCPNFGIPLEQIERTSSQWHYSSCSCCPS